MLSIAVLGAGRHRAHPCRQHRRASGRAAGRRRRHGAAAAARLARACGARTLTLDEALGADAVLIASPTPTHADYIERAAARRTPGVLREADRSVSGSGARLPGRGAAAGSLN